MCELFGVSSNLEVNIGFSFEEWLYRGRENPHGYGFAYWDQAKPVIIKNPESLSSAPEAQKDRIRNLQSKIFLCHVRLSSGTAHILKNTHPFLKEKNGKLFVFAHNGTLHNWRERLRLQGEQPKGDTDTEWAFYWLLEHLPEPGKADFAQSLKELADQVSELGTFNFLMSDGKTLWAYADSSLNYLERKPPHSAERIYLIHGSKSQSRMEFKRPDERVILVATQPLTNEKDWRPLKKGNLLAIANGEIKKIL